MVKALFDTNIIIDYLNAIPEAREELARYDHRCISIITWMEVLIGAKPEVASATRDFLASFHIITIDEAVAERAVLLRQRYKVKLPGYKLFLQIYQEVHLQSLLEDSVLR